MGYRALSNWFVGFAVFVFAAITGVQTLLGKEQMRLVPASSRVAPVPSVEVLDRPYFSELADWAADNFWTRGPLTALSAGVRYFGFNTANDDRVMPGADGWLFFGDDAHLDLLSGEVELDEYTIYMTELLGQRRDWLRARGSDYVYLIGPAAHSIYPEALPFRSPDIMIPTPIERMAAVINEAEPNLVIAPHEALRSAKDDIVIYHKNDSHWTRAGAAIALNEALEALGYDRIDWEIENFDNSPGSFGRMMGLPITQLSATARAPGLTSPESVDASAYCEPLGRDAVRKCALFRQKGRTGRALVLGDSFGNFLQQPVVRSFEETLILNLWETDAIPEKRFPVETIEAFKPDVVIELTAEYRAQPCSETQMGGCRGYIGTANPFGEAFEANAIEVFSGNFSAEYDLAEYASERSGYTSGAIRLNGLDVPRSQKVFAEITVEDGFEGRILGGIRGKIPDWVDSDKILVRSRDSDFSNTFTLEIAPEPTGDERYIRFATPYASRGVVSVNIRPGLE